MTRVWSGYVRLVETLAVTGAAVMVVIAVLQVYYRYVMGQSLFWSEETMRYLMIWIVCIGAGLAYTRGQFLGMRVLVDALPAPLRRGIDLINALLMLTFLLVVLRYGWDFAWRTRAQSAVALQVSMFWVHGALVVGMFLTALHVFLNGVLGLFVEPPRNPHEHEEGEP